MRFGKLWLVKSGRYLGDNIIKVLWEKKIVDKYGNKFLKINPFWKFYSGKLPICPYVQF